MKRQRQPWRWLRRGATVLTTATNQLAQVLADRRALRAYAVWALADLLSDAGGSGSCSSPSGTGPNPDSLLVAYGLANMAAVIPISAGGLGILEGVLIPSLAGFGVPRAATVLGVVP